MIDSVQCSANYRTGGHSALVGREVASDRAQHPFQAHDPLVCMEYPLQLLHPVRQAEDLVGPERHLPSEDIALMAVNAETDAINGPQMWLACAANPFDFWPLIERGFAEWSRTSDALIDGAPFEGALDLFRDGLGSGRLDLFLGHLETPGSAEADLQVVASGAVPDQEALFQDLGVNREVEQGAQARPIHPAVPGEQGRVDSLGGCRPQQLAEPALYDIVSVFHGYLQGHLLWVAPEYRGRGLVGQYFDAALAVAERHGLKGFMFLSTLPFWERRAPRYGFEARGCIRQPNGPDVIGWFREVC